MEAEVEVAVAVDVHEDGPGGIPAGQPRRPADAVTSSNFHPPQVPVEGVRALGPAEIDVGQAIAVHVAERDAAALDEDPVAEDAASP